MAIIKSLPTTEFTFVLHSNYETVLIVCLVHISSQVLADSLTKELFIVQEDNLAPSNTK